MNDGIEQMLGMVFTQVYNEKDEILVFRNDNMTFRFLHHQNCCEDVHIADIVGDLQDLVGSPILLAEVSSSDDDGVVNSFLNSNSGNIGGYSVCDEWTFYKFATRKGYVDVRWIGSSNGYYSTEVSLLVNHNQVD